MKLYRILRHPTVEQDLLSIVTMIKNYAGVEIAFQKLSQIEEAIQSLSMTPHKGSLRNEVCPNLRVVPAGRKGVVCFFVDDGTKTVRIFAIGYAGTDWSTTVLERGF